MKILWAKLFCRHLFWMVIWLLTLHMEDLSWGLAAIFMCPNVFWGLVFQSRPPQLLQVQFLSLQLTLPSKWHLERVKWDSPQHAERMTQWAPRNTWGGFKTPLQVCFQGWEESGQLCSLAEGFSIRCCGYFPCFTLKQGVCRQGPDL